jgi:hypothetical protein
MVHYHKDQANFLKKWFTITTCSSDKIIKIVTRKIESFKSC